MFVTSLSMSDHNLLEVGDHVVIGSDVHLSGHTVEAGIVKAAVVRLGNGRGGAGPAERERGSGVRPRVRRALVGWPLPSGPNRQAEPP